MPLYRNILVIRLSSLGDVLLSMPAVKAIKAASPSATLSWIVEGGVGELLAHQDFVDRVIEFPRQTLSQALKGGRLMTAVHSLRAFATRLREREYDLVLDFHGIVKSALIVKGARGTRKIGFNGIFAKEGSWLAYDERVGGREAQLHKVSRNMLIASHIGARNFPAVSLAAPPAAVSYIDRFMSEQQVSGPLFAVNPFCSRGSEFKRWNLANYGELIRKVVDTTGVKSIILWGPAEKEEAIRLKEMSGDKAILACSTTVAQLHALLQRTDLYIGGDTGVMHLAAFAGVPVVAIFGPTDHRVNGPYGEHHTIVRKEVKCNPCRDKSCKERTCLSSISVNEVFQEVRAAWERTGSH
jgi:lipopolysaccharide heptosyltransferase I